MLHPVLAVSVVALATAASPVRASDPPAQGDPARPLGIDELLQAPEDADPSWESLRGRVVVVEYWATWCQPCLAYGLPHMNELAEQFEDRPVLFISVTDESTATVERFLQRIPIRGWIGIDPDKSALEAYGITAIPRTLVVDKEGRLAALTYPTRVTADALEAVLEGDPPDLPVDARVPGHVVPGEDSGVTTVPPAGELLFNASVRRLPARPDTYRTARTFNAITLGAATPRHALSAVSGIPAQRIEGPADLLDDTWLAVAVKVPRGDLLEPVAFSALQAALDIEIDRVTRPTEVLVLSDPSGSGGRLRRADGYMNSLQRLEGSVTAVGTESALLVDTLEHILGATVIDETGLQGAFDWTLEWDEGKPPDATAAGIETQLGLSIRAELRPMDWLVVHLDGSDANQTTQPAAPDPPMESAVPRPP